MWKKNILPNGQQTTRHISYRPISTQRTFSKITHLRKQSSTTPRAKDRETLKPESSEVTKSGTDNEVAQHSASYDPGETAPERELESTAEEHKKEGKEGNPLNMSPANPGISKWRDPVEGAPERGADRDASSAKGAAKKNRKVVVKEDGIPVSYH